MRTKLIILTSIAMALVVMAFPTNKFQPKTVWEHYCKYTLGIHPSQATEEQYDYFLDCWSGDDEYQYLYDYYENKYPEYNNHPKQRNQMKKKSKNQVYIPHQDKWNEHFPTPGKPNPNYYTDSGAIFNKHLRTQNKLKQKRK